MLERLEKIYAFVVDYQVRHDGLGPTIRECGDAIDVRSTSLVDYYLKELKDQGRIRYAGTGRARCIQAVGGRWIAPRREVAA